MDEDELATKPEWPAAMTALSDGSVLCVVPAKFAEGNVNRVGAIIQLGLAQLDQLAEDGKYFLAHPEETESLDDLLESRLSEGYDRMAATFRERAATTDRSGGLPGEIHPL